MCGILGIIGGEGGERERRAEITSLASMLTHRGPDSAGEWIEQDSALAFGHRRLSILDLSTEGHQPMHSASGRYVISYNGEVYNYQGMAEELAALGHSFRGHSDTEVLLAGVEQWGLGGVLARANGMFAIALWDREKKELSLVRDRVGIKPLFYAWVAGRFVFASELRVITKAARAALEIDRRQLALMLRYNYVPAPFSIYQGVYKLLPGTVLSLSGEALKAPPSSFDPSVSPQAYWSLEDSVSPHSEPGFRGTYPEAKAEAARLLKDAVSMRMIADVPLGAFLSGGIDSSLVVALMQEQSSSPVQTFSIGFNESTYDEAVYAKAVAAHLGTTHTELYLSASEAASAVPLLGSMYDEPFADSSQLPTYLVSKLARESVTVSLSGDGGDELFYGYRRYPETEALWQKISWCPSSIRRLVASLLFALPLFSLQRLYDQLLRPGAKGEKYRNPFFMAYQIAVVLSSREEKDLYDLFLSHWLANEKIMREPVSELSVLPKHKAWSLGQDTSSTMMLLDALTYLPDDILCKVDRASMAVSLEARVPIVDYRMLEFAFSLPNEFRFAPNASKRILRDILYDYVPRKLIERPKMGFGVPIGSWLRGELRDWAEDLLSEARLERDGLLNVRYVRQLWQDHLSSHAHAQNCLWNVLMFQAWKQAHWD